MAHIKSAWRDPALRSAILIFVVVRVLLALWLPLVRTLYTEPLTPHPILRPYLGVDMESNPWLEPWQRWDTLHYQAVAERGYSPTRPDLLVPPLYPLLVRLVAPLFRGSTLLAGLVVSNLACLLLFVAFHRMVQDETGDPRLATRSVAYLAVFPSAFFLFAAYTESLFLLAVTVCLVASRRQRWGLAGLWGGVAALTRTPGVLLSIPLAYSAFRAWRVDREWRPLLAPAGTAVGALIFPLSVWLVLGLSPATPLLVQATWSAGGIAVPGANILEAARRILAGTMYQADAWDLFLIIVFLFMAIPTWKSVSRPLGVYYLAFLGLYLLRMGDIDPLRGVTRYVLVFLPAFIVFGKWGERRWFHRLLLYGSWFGLLFLSGQFALWGWVG